MTATPGASRGVLYPRDLPAFHREPATGDLATFVRWFWIPEWDLPPGHTSRQHLIGFPACNLVVEETGEETVVGLSGPTTTASYRDLTGKGWAVGALLRPAAIPALVGDASEVRDTYRAMEHPDLAEAVRAAMTASGPASHRHRTAIAAFSAWLRGRLDEPSAEALLANRLAETAESDATVVTVADLAARLHVSVRTVQRLAATYVGLPPAALIRRRRIQEAADKLRQNPGIDLASLAHEFGYADHAHLTNDFRASLGFTPSTYRRGLD